MKSTLLLASLATVAAVTATASFADTRSAAFEHDAAQRTERGPASNPNASAHDHAEHRADRGHGTDRRLERESVGRAPRGDRAGHRLRAVPNAAGPGEPGHGWRYFSDPAHRRAVVISPQGAYFFGTGHGLHPVAAAQPGA